MRYSAHDGSGHTFGAQRVGVFPDALFSSPRLNSHHAMCDAVSLKFSDVVVKLVLKFLEENIADIFIEQSSLIITQQCYRRFVDGEDAARQIMRADQIMAVF